MMSLHFRSLTNEMECSRNVTSLTDIFIDNQTCKEPEVVHSSLTDGSDLLRNMSYAVLLLITTGLIVILIRFIKNNRRTKHENTVLVIGASKTGKKSIITNFKNMNPTAQSWVFLEKDYTEYRIPKYPRPNVIWLVVNYQSSIHDNELEILKFPNQIPIIIVINQVDLLQELNISNDRILAKFHEQLPDCLNGHQRLINIRQRLMTYNKSMVILSLKQEEEFDRIIGMNNLIELTNQQFNIKTTISRIQSEKRVLLMGYTSTGKSSLINAFAKQNLASVSLDGQPMTKQIQEYYLPNQNLTLIDSIGFEKKRNNRDKFEQLKNYPQPDFIWFLVNFHSSIDQKELNIVNQLFPTIPTIIIVNFTDVLQDFNDEIDLNNPIFATKQSFQTVKQSLLQFKGNYPTTIQDMVVISLRSEEDNDRPRGLQTLLDKTIRHFQ